MFYFTLGQSNGSSRPDTKPSETMSQNKISLPLSCFSQLFVTANKHDALLHSLGHPLLRRARVCRHLLSLLSALQNKCLLKREDQVSQVAPGFSTFPVIVLYSSHVENSVRIYFTFKYVGPSGYKSPSQLFSQGQQLDWLSRFTMARLENTKFQGRWIWKETLDEVGSILALGQ